MRPHGIAALQRLLSAALIGVVVWLGQGYLPVEKLGELEGLDRIGGSLVVAGAWLVGLALVIRWLARPARRPAEVRRVEQRASLAAFCLALLCLVPFASYDWGRALWRSRFLFGAHVALSAALVGAVILRRELARLRLGARLRRGPAAALALLGTGAVLVVVAESILDWAMFRELRFVPDHASVAELAGNFTLNALLVASVLGVVWGSTDRLGLAVLATGSSYVALAVCNAFKLTSLHEPIRVLDILYLGELGSILPDFLPAVWLGPVAAVGMLVFAGCLWASRPLAAVDPRRDRVVVIAASLTVLLGLTRLASLAPEERQVWLFWQRPACWDARQASLAEGMLFHLLGDAVTARVPAPPGYDADELARIRAAAAPEEGLPRLTDANVVVVMVESLMDPDRLPVTFTEDPMPYLHRLMRTSSSGTSISPVFGSGSANAEFEVLTGLSMRFLPVGSLPYRQYVQRDLPALPRLFRERGHRTVGILVDPPSFFDRPSCYPRLGFEESVWLDERPGVERDATGRWASDDELVDAVLEVLADDDPAFVFAFTNSTHAPYDRARYGHSGLDVVDAPSEDVRAELGGYASALRVTDRALERLVEGLEKLDEKTLLLVVGDHLPPFAAAASIYDSGAFATGTPAEGARQKHAVPALLWTSFPTERRRIRCTHAELGLEILETLHVDPGPLLRVLRAARPDLGPANPVNAPDTPALRDYRLSQYDVLFGAPPLATWADE